MTQQGKAKKMKHHQSPTGRHTNETELCTGLLCDF